LGNDRVRELHQGRAALGLRAKQAHAGLRRRLSDRKRASTAVPRGSDHASVRLRVLAAAHVPRRRGEWV
jgi:hypothetical protein